MTLSESVVTATDALGRLDLEWEGVNASQSVSEITFLAADLGSLGGADVVSAAGVTLDRGGLPDMTVQLPPTLLPGVATPLVVTVFQDGEPAPGYYVEIQAQGGSVTPDEGLTDVDGDFQASATLPVGETQLTLSVVLRAEAGGPALAQQIVQAFAGEAPRVLVTSREDRAFGATTLRDAVGPVTRIGNGATETSDVELDAQGSLVRVEAHGSAPEVTSGLQPSTYFQLDFEVTGAPFEATLATFAAAGSGSWTMLYRLPATGGSEMLRCEAPGDPNCAQTTGGAFTLDPGRYQLQGRAYAGTSELEVTFAPAP